MKIHFFFLFNKAINLNCLISSAFNTSFVLFSLKSFDNVLSFRNEFFQNYEKRNNSRRNNIINIDEVKKEEVKPQIELPINKTTHVFSVKNDINGLNKP